MLKFSSGIFECESNGSIQSSEIPIAHFQLAFTHGAMSKSLMSDSSIFHPLHRGRVQRSISNARGTFEPHLQPQNLAKNVTLVAKKQPKIIFCHFRQKTY